ncbi:MAG: hypothetical protein P1V97_21155 [Planctomycetota bacterium]|nr:hypothetical protein [Planctomycetota bacterium]
MAEEQNDQEAGYNTTDAATDASSGCLSFGTDFELGCITEALGCAVFLACFGAVNTFLVTTIFWVAS